MLLRCAWFTLTIVGKWQLNVSTWKGETEHKRDQVKTVLLWKQDLCSQVQACNARHRLVLTTICQRLATRKRRLAFLGFRKTWITTTEIDEPRVNQEKNHSQNPFVGDTHTWWNELQRDEDARWTVTALLQRNKTSPAISVWKIQLLQCWCGCSKFVNFSTEIWAVSSTG